MPEPDEITNRILADALTPDALQKSIESIITTPPAGSGLQVDVAVIKTDQTTGAEAKVSANKGWFSAAAWAQWLKDRGWAAGGQGTIKIGGKDSP
jgi:hypothetical protein